MNKFNICEKNKCTGCRLCIEICPQKCIHMKKEYDGFMYPEIDESKCIHCNLCKQKCPNNNNIKTSKSTFYMAIHKDDNILKKSSSGGAFSGIASYVLNNNGVVAGVSYNKDKDELKHIIIDNKKDLDLIRLSKYYQSNTEGIYKKVLEYLKDNIMVLFSGTACQIAALYSFIPKKYIENLITVDVLCHGVSNKEVIAAYIKSEEKKHHKKIVDYKFRVKNEDIGWKRSTIMELFFDDGTTYIEKDFDVFFIAFNENIILRESCYNCNYCGIERISDFTIADFWGIKNERATKEERRKGISLLVCNSLKANNLISFLKNDLKIVKISPDEAIPFNKAFVKPNDRPEKRELFFKKLNEGVDFIKIVKSIYWKRYIKMIIKKIVGTKLIKKIKGEDNE